MKHIPVLQKEVVELLAPQPNTNYIDCTLGFGGHAKLLLEKTAPNGHLLGIEWDEKTLFGAKENLSDFGERFQFYRGNFVDLGLIVRDWNVKEINGILIDLGPSTYQLTDESRGFSFQKDSLLDMRQDQSQRLTACEIINKSSEKELRNILFSGEEKFAKAIAKKIIENRLKKPIETTFELVEIVYQATPPSYRYNRKLHFATATFRALRMAVNDEIGNLEKLLPQAVSVLSPGGRIAIISFHSLEDRIVKHFLQSRQDLDILAKKPIQASNREIQENPSSRSAKLRGAEKIN